VSKLLSRKVLVPTAIIVAALVILYLLPIPKVALPEISIPAEHVFDLFGFPITNTLLASWLTMALLVIGAWLITRKIQEVPGRWQGFLEMVLEALLGLIEGAAGKKAARQFFPIVTTIFLFVAVSNWLGLTPLFGSWGALHHADHGNEVQWLGGGHSVGLWKPPAAGAEAGHGEQELYALAPMFRAATTDMNVTLALAIVSVVLAQYFGVKALGPLYFGKFIAIPSLVKAFTRKGVGCTGRIGALGMALIDVFVGIVESISEIGKVISFSFRLFGNIFAGEVLLGVMGFLIPYLVSIPFYGLEIFVGLVQALVFMMLSVAFFVVATTTHGEEGH
jgi:F-type H+-transporting ATPase subunit a